MSNRIEFVTVGLLRIIFLTVFVGVLFLAVFAWFSCNDLIAGLAIFGAVFVLFGLATFDEFVKGIRQRRNKNRVGK